MGLEVRVCALVLGWSCLPGGGEEGAVHWTRRSTFEMAWRLWMWSLDFGSAGIIGICSVQDSLHASPVVSLMGSR